MKAQKRLGELYYHGDGVDQDYYEAYAWSMAYAGTRQLGGLAREGKQTARSALRKLDDEKHHDAYVKSKQYFEKFVLPFHPNAREVGPEKYRIVVRSRKAQLAQAKQQGKGAALAKSPVTAGTAKVSSSAAKRLCESIKSQNKNIERTKEDVTRVFDTIKIEIDSIYRRALEKNFTVAYPIDFIPSKIVSTKNEQAVLARTMAAVERNQGLSNNKQKVVSKLPLTANPELTKAIPAKPPTETLAGSTRETTVAATGISVEKTQAEAQKLSSTEVNVNAAQAKPGESAATATETASQGEKSVAASTGVAKSVISQSQPAATQTAAAKPDNEKTVIEKRDYREVHNMFIRHRSNINGIYLRAHEQDNSLKGRIVLDLAIAASGKVEKVSITSSDLDSSVLQEELIDYIKRMSFESKNADLYNITYPLDFLP
ncbi:MAG: AgmX/PglI C-terminal domain-containing protein [Gammaproteobacteria bacterium]